jgi:hypothetical protein
MSTLRLSARFRLLLGFKNGLKSKRVKRIDVLASIVVSHSHHLCVLSASVLHIKRYGFPFCVFFIFHTTIK